MKNRHHYNIHVHGRVQGVGYRWNAAKEARIRGITGYIRNMSDGSVYIEAEGETEQLESFTDWCRTGPAFCNVESIDIEIIPPVNYKDFRIEH